MERKAIPILLNHVDFRFAFLFIKSLSKHLPYKITDKTTEF